MNQDISYLNNFLEENYQQNISALEKINSDLAKALDLKQFNNISMEIMHNGQLNIIREGKYVYSSDPLQDIQNQLEIYLNNPQKLQELAPSGGSNLPDSLFLKTYNKIFNISPLKKNVKNNTSRHQNKNIPLYIVFGIGLGYHLEYLLDHYDIRHLIIVEDDLEMLKLSLHTANWEKILDRYQSDNRSLDLIYGQDGKMMTLQLFQALQDTNLIFITNAYFYKHYTRKLFSDCMEKLAEEYILPSLGWGYFDDEYATVEQTVSNMKKDLPFLTHTRLPDIKTPAFIVASGPSLDQTISTIKEQQDHAVIFSCGTAITPLFRAGITPDFHIEMERTYGRYQNLMRCADHDFIRKLHLIAPCRVHPYLLSASDFNFTYVKHPDAGGTIIDDHAVRVSYDNPTVTNAAFSLACEFGFQNICFFGTDLGYKDKERHHSQNTIYFGKNKKNVKFREIKQVPGINEEMVYTTEIFYWTKKALEKRISSEKNIFLYNLSDGVHIEGTEVISPWELKRITNNCFQKTEIIEKIKTLFSTINNNQQTINARLEKIIEDFDFTINEIRNILGSGVQNSDEIIDKFNFLYNFLEQQLLEINETCCILLRGSFRHFTRLIYTHVSACPDEQASVEFINQSIYILYDFLNQAKNMLEQLQTLDQVT